MAFQTLKSKTGAFLPLILEEGRASIHLSVYVSTSLPIIHLSTHPLTHPLFIYPPIHPPIYYSLSTHLLAYSSSHPSTHPSAHSPTYPPIYPPINPLTHLPTHPADCLHLLCLRHHKFNNRRLQHGSYPQGVP